MPRLERCSIRPAFNTPNRSVNCDLMDWVTLSTVCQYDGFQFIRRDQQIQSVTNVALGSLSLASCTHASMRSCEQPFCSIRLLAPKTLVRVLIRGSGGVGSMRLLRADDRESHASIVWGHCCGGRCWRRHRAPRRRAMPNPDDTLHISESKSNF